MQHKANMLGACMLVPVKVTAAWRRKAKCDRDMDKQANGLVQFGTPPSLHVIGNLSTRASARALYPHNIHDDLKN